jgi:hypothetical protein
LLIAFSNDHSLTFIPIQVTAAQAQASWTRKPVSARVIRKRSRKARRRSFSPSAGEYAVVILSHLQLRYVEIAQALEYAER